MNVNEHQKKITEYRQHLTYNHKTSTETQNHKNDLANKETLKASAKTKLIAGEKLTEEEANVLVGV